MLFRFTLDNDILGPKIINECDGWKDCKLKLERDKNFHSLIEYFDGSFIFYGNNGVVDGGIDYIKEVEQTQGFDAKILVHIDLSMDGYTYYVLFSGQLNLALAQEVPDNKIQIPIVRDDFWSKFINRLDTPVNIQSELSLDDESINQVDNISLRLTNQILRKTSIFSTDVIVSDSGTEVSTSSVVKFSQIGLDATREEIDTTFNLPFSLVDLLSEIVDSINLEEDSSTGYLTVSVDGDAIVIASVSAGLITGVDVEVSVIVNDDIAGITQIAISGTSPNLSNISERVHVNGSDTIFCQKGDLIKILISYALTLDTVTNASFEFGVDDFTVTVVQDSISPDTSCNSFLNHDAAGQICDRIISQNQTFYSEHLGSPNTLYRQYEGDGCGWKYAITKGLQIRQYSLIEKPFFLSFNQWWKGINPVLCLGLGYEEIDGSQVVRVEEMDHFYDASSTSLDISNVREITRVYDQDFIFKTVKVGYTQWQSEDIAGIDDPQTKHTYATRFVKTGTDLNIESEFIAASLAIETTRRTTRIKSADYKFDNNTFLIAINPIPVDVSPETSPDVNDYKPELDENFSSITNLLNAETRYNSRITPARNLMRWIRYISGALQSYIDSKFKFVSGEGNYDMVSDMSNVSDGCDEIKTELSEKQDIPVYNDPLHLALQYEITVPLEWEDYLLIRDNRKKAIGISQTTTGHVKFFIDTLEYELVKGVATIKAWPIEYFDIQVQEEVPAMRGCIPAVVPVECEDAYLTEDSFEYETEAGECLILN